MSESQPANATSQVGIFWWFEQRLIADSTPLAKAELYGDALTHPIGHLDYWSALQRHKGVRGF